MGRLTASDHKEIVGKMDKLLKKPSSLKTKTTPLVEKIVNREESLNLPSLTWGRKHEANAIAKFIEVEGPHHTGFSVATCGLFIDGNRPYLGASPDRIGQCDCHGSFVVEAKCPSSLVQSGISDNDLQSYLHRYKTQINSQMALAGTTKGYFVLWTPESFESVVVQFDEKLWADVSKKCQIFFQNFVVRHLLKIESFRYCGLCEKVLLNENEIPDGERADLLAILCNQCMIWHHLKCVHVSLESVNRDEWVCSFCRAPEE
jgi:hypothetical protein